MTDTQKAIFKLIKAAINKEKFVSDCVIELDKIYMLAKQQQLIPLVFYPLCDLEGFTSNPLYLNYVRYLSKCLIMDKAQLEEIEVLKRAFASRNIRFIIIKGADVKSLYPKNVMRVMGDIDILVHEDDIDKANLVMKNRDYSFIEESEYDFVWEKPNGLHFELHKYLFNPLQEDLYEYFENWWGRAVSVSDTEYAFSKEDMFVYNFAHFARHYRDKFAGVKWLIDLYAYKVKYPDLDFDYIRSEIVKFRFDMFYDNIMDLIECVFNGASENEVINVICDTLFEYGVFGSQHEATVQNAINMSLKNKSPQVTTSLRRFFPDYDIMVEKYPSLEGHRHMLPIAWIRRIIGALIFRRENIKVNYDYVKTMSKENMEKRKKQLSYVGLPLYDSKEL